MRKSKAPHSTPFFLAAALAVIATACSGTHTNGNPQLPPTTQNPAPIPSPNTFWSCSATIIKAATDGWCGLGAPPPPGDNVCVVTPPGTSTPVTGWCGTVPPGGGGVGNTGASGVDWLTWGFDVQRTGYNPKETQLSTSTVPSLKLKWASKLGGAIIAQPLVATHVAVGSAFNDIVYVANAGQLSAVTIADGKLLWKQQLQTNTVCNKPWGIVSTPVIDRATNRIYIVDAMGQLYAFDLGTGTAATGWPNGGVKVVNDPGADYVWSALQFSASAGQLYIGTASYEDCVTPWKGSVVSVNAASASVTGTWVAAQSPQWGSGVWGWGGVSLDPVSGNLYGVTGNTEENEDADASDSVIALSPGLSLIAQNAPVPRSGDVDFGASVLLYDDGGSCLATENKTGTFFTYDRTNIAAGPAQSLLIGPAESSFSTGNLEAPAYSPVTHMLYEGNAVYDASLQSPYPRGLLAFSIQAGCKFTLAWQQPFNISSDNTVDNPVGDPTVANGVVYVATGLSGQIFAYDAMTGAPLWKSTGITNGPIFNSPAIAGGMIFAGSAAGTLYAFGL